MVAVGKQDALLAQMRKGTLQYCVLALLADDERYGFDLVRSLAETDGMVTSAHKMLPAYSQAALILARTERLDASRLDAAFEATNTRGAGMSSRDALTRNGSGATADDAFLRSATTAWFLWALRRAWRLASWTRRGIRPAG